jgi:hypothetical protein
MLLAVVRADTSDALHAHEAAVSTRLPNRARGKFERAKYALLSISCTCAACDPSTPAHAHQHTHLHEESLVVEPLELLEEGLPHSEGAAVVAHLQLQRHQTHLEGLAQERVLLLLRPLDAVLAHLHLHTVTSSWGSMDRAPWDVVRTAVQAHTTHLCLDSAGNIEEVVEQDAEKLASLGLGHKLEVRADVVYELGEPCMPITRPPCTPHHN